MFRGETKFFWLFVFDLLQGIDFFNEEKLALGELANWIFLSKNCGFPWILQWLF